VRAAVVRAEPKIRITHPGGYRELSIADAIVLADELNAALAEALPQVKVPAKPELRVGARVRRTALPYRGCPVGTLGTVRLIHPGGLFVNVAVDGADVEPWDVQFFEVIG
jgi:hypothetical protein